MPGRYHACHSVTVDHPILCAQQTQTSHAVLAFVLADLIRLNIETDTRLLRDESLDFS